MTKRVRKAPAPRLAAQWPTYPQPILAAVRLRAGTEWAQPLNSPRRCECGAVGVFGMGPPLVDVPRWFCSEHKPEGLFRWLNKGAAK